MDLTQNQRKSIKQMLFPCFPDFSVKRINKEVLPHFNGYNLPIEEVSLSPYMYYKELRELPLKIKRDIILRIFEVWMENCNYDSLSMHEAFSKLMYLKICSGPEYFFMSTIYSLIEYFGNKGMWAITHGADHYELNFGSKDKQIQFYHDENSNSLLIHISGELLNEKNHFDKQPTQDQIRSLKNVLKDQSFIRTMPWIYTNGSIEYNYINFGLGKGIIEFVLTNIEYQDSNGVD